MSEPPQPVALLIGECHSPQFCRAFSDGMLDDVLADTQNRNAESIPEGYSLISLGTFVPDLVVCYQSIPDEYPSADIDQLIGMLPLSRFVVAFSPWCESIGRTEQRWPSAWSVPLAHAAARIRFELQQLANGQAPLPATTSRDEAFARLAAGRLQNAEPIGNGLSVRIWSADLSLKECFECVARSVGFTVSENASDLETAHTHIVATAFVSDETLRQVKRLRVNNSGVDIIVASDMATPGEVMALREAGATAVISQLRFAEDLIDHFRIKVVTGATFDA